MSGDEEVDRGGEKERETDMDKVKNKRQDKKCTKWR